MHQISSCLIHLLLVRTVFLGHVPPDWWPTHDPHHFLQATSHDHFKKGESTNGTYRFECANGVPSAWASGCPHKWVWLWVVDPQRREGEEDAVGLVGEGTVGRLTEEKWMWKSFMERRAEQRGKKWWWWKVWWTRPYIPSNSLFSCLSHSPEPRKTTPTRSLQPGHPPHQPHKDCSTVLSQKWWPISTTGPQVRRGNFMTCKETIKKFMWWGGWG